MATGTETPPDRTERREVVVTPTHEVASVPARRRGPLAAVVLIVLIVIAIILALLATHQPSQPAGQPNPSGSAMPQQQGPPNG